MRKPLALIRCIAHGCIGLILVLASLRLTWASDLPIEFTLGAGLLLPGEVNLDISPPSIPVNIQPAFIWKAGVDVPVIPHWYVSTRLLQASVAVQELEEVRSLLPLALTNQVPSRVSGFQVSAGPKASVTLNDSLTLTFALYGGYRSISGDTDYANSKGFALDGATELQVQLGGGWRQFWEVGFLTQPVGGREGDYYLTFGPLVYVLAGVAY